MTLDISLAVDEERSLLVFLLSVSFSSLLPKRLSSNTSDAVSKLTVMKQLNRIVIATRGSCNNHQFVTIIARLEKHSALHVLRIRIALVLIPSRAFFLV
jgi:hypothetical protein